jgi:hypothetical protein
MLPVFALFLLLGKSVRCDQQLPAGCFQIRREYFMPLVKIFLHSGLKDAIISPLLVLSVKAFRPCNRKQSKITISRRTTMKVLFSQHALGRWAGLGLTCWMMLALLPGQGFAAAAKDGSGATRKKPARTRAEMIQEAEIKAVQEALRVRQDQESTQKFSDRAQQEYDSAKLSADQARELVDKSQSALNDANASKEAAQNAVAEAQAAAEKALEMAKNALKESKLAELDTTGITAMHKGCKAELIAAAERQDQALSVRDAAKQAEQYYREQVKRRLSNAEDFYYIAKAAMEKGGNAQSLEFAIKAKAEIEQAKIAENEANIRAEAAVAAEKVYQARLEATAAVKLKERTLQKMLQLVNEISSALLQAYEAAKQSASASQKVVSMLQQYSSAKDEIISFTNQKVASLTQLKVATEKKESLAQEAVTAAQAVLAAKQRAQAEAESRAKAALSDAQALVIGQRQEESKQAPAAN